MPSPLPQAWLGGGRVRLAPHSSIDRSCIFRICRRRRSCVFSFGRFELRDLVIDLVYVMLGDRLAGLVGLRVEAIAAEPAIGAALVPVPASFLRAAFFARAVHHAGRLRSPVIDVPLARSFSFSICFFSRMA